MCAFRLRNLTSAACAAIALVAATPWANPAAAQEWPTRNVRAVVPLSAGSAVDIVPRIVFEQVSTQLGQTIVVDNRTGASGTIGTRAVATAPPDGYTLLAHSSAVVISPFTVANAHYDTLKDFVPVASLGNLPNVLVVAPSKNIRTVQELVATARARPVTFGVVGFGTPIYLATEKFRLAAKFPADPIPFRGAPEAVTEVMTGRVDFYYAPVSAALAFIRDGKLAALTVSSAQRSAALPGRADLARSRLPEFRFQFLDRRVRAGRHPGADRRAAQPRDRQGARGADGAREARAAGRRSPGDGHRRRSTGSSGARSPRRRSSPRRSTSNRSEPQAVRTERPPRHSSRYTRSRRSWRSCASIDKVAIGRASRRLMEIGSPVSSQ